MRILLQTGLTLLLALPAPAGDLSGKVLITKKLSKKTVAPAIYDLRGAATPVVPSTNDILNELDRTVVLLQGKKQAGGSAQNVTIAQRNGRFEPDLAVVPVGSTVQFPNDDPIFHNVFSLSKTQSFDLGYYPKSQTRTVKFDRPGVVQVYCHIHANMYAAIVVTDTPWYGRPAADGTFSWANVPAGHYKLTAWHKIAGLYQTEVDVPETGQAHVTIQVPVDVERH